MLALRPYQRSAIDALRREYSQGRRAPLLCLPTGAGKCLGIGTPVLRYDGAIDAVENVQAGDSLMGPDSKPRRVLSTTRDRGNLFKITPIKGAPWVCNDVHILTLVATDTSAVTDIDLQSYLRSSQNFKRLNKQFTPENGIDFARSEELPLDPYFLGVWYGDGTKSLNGIAISKPDDEILAVCRQVAEQFRLHVRTDGHPGCPTHHLTAGKNGGSENRLLSLLRQIVGHRTHLPHRYLVASRPDRLQFLAGLLDTDGYMNKSGFEIVQKQRGFADGICFLARSLGMRAIMSEKIVGGAAYWRVSISGDCSVIPTRIPRKRAPQRKQIKCATRTGFSVEAIGEGEYAGFTLDGDGRFLLGDFTVTHNTIVASEIIRSAISRGNRVLFAAGRIELLDQTLSKLEFTGIARSSVRLIQADNLEGPDDAAVTVASVPTLASKRWADKLPQADVVILDECHHIGAASWARIAKHYAQSKLLGLTATPARSDNRSLGDIFDCIVVGATVADLTAAGHLVPARVYSAREPTASRHLALSPVEAYEQHASGQRAMIFCTTVAHAETVAAEFAYTGVSSAVVHGKLSSDARRQVLSQFRSGQIQALCNVGILVEGFDDPSCAVAILARRFGHAGTFIQVCGRVLRPFEGKQHAVIVDLCGSVLEHGTPDADRAYSLSGKGIASSRKSIRQCPRCGGVFLAGPQTCPMCAGELPTLQRRTPTSTGAGVVEVAPRTQARPWFMLVAARYPSICPTCAKPISRGASIVWAKGQKPLHEDCAPNGALIRRFGSRRAA